ncbi:MAG: hypothetical protein R6W76_21625 [Caldilinea sp.]|jgi:hypothetical protein
MLSWMILLMLIVGAHFCLTVLVPAQAGRAWLLWPVATDTRPVVGLFDGEGRAIPTVLLTMSGLCYLCAAASLLGWVVPAALWPSLVLVGGLGSLLLFLIFLNRYAVLPLMVDLLLLWGVMAQHWTVSIVRGF